MVDTPKESNGDEAMEDNPLGKQSKHQRQRRRSKPRHRKNSDAGIGGNNLDGAEDEDNPAQPGFEQATDGESEDDNYMPLCVPLYHEGWLLPPPVLNPARGVVFGTVRGVIISRAGITVFLAGFRAAPLTPTLRLLLGGVILCCSIAIAFFWGVHHVYII